MMIFVKYIPMTIIYVVSHAFGSHFYSHLAFGKCVIFVLGASAHVDNFVKPTRELRTSPYPLIILLFD